MVYQGKIAAGCWMGMRPYTKNGTGEVFQEGTSIAQVTYSINNWRRPDHVPRSIAGKIEVPTDLSLSLIRAWRDERPLILHMNDLEPSISIRLSMWDTWRTFTRFRIEGKTT